VSLGFAVPGSKGFGLAGLGTQWIITIGFALVLLLMAVLTGFGLKNMSAIKARMADLVTESNVKTESVYRMRSLSRERFASLGQLVVLQDPFERDEEYMLFLAQASEFVQARERLFGLGMNAREQMLWERVRDLIQHDEQLHARVLKLAQTNQSQAALTVLLNEVRPLEKELLNTFDRMIEQQHLANQQSLLDSEADYREAAAYMLGLAMLALAMGLAIARIVVLRSRHTEAMLSRESEAAHAAAEQLSWAASHDSLTGLVNRREMQRRLEALILDTQTHGAQHVLLYIDLDKFKAVNDGCGHLAGDELLRQLANIFTRHVRSGDIVARLGGDEFCIGLLNCSIDKARLIAETIRNEVTDYRFSQEDQVFQVGASIGLVCLVPGMDVTAALKAADTACYQAKEQGRNRVCVHGES
jgi:diguanylate cyclase (GGDEF)-like protein